MDQKSLNHVVKNQGNNSAIFGPFLHLQGFFQNKELNVESSNMASA